MNIKLVTLMFAAAGLLAACGDKEEAAPKAPPKAETATQAQPATAAPPQALPAAAQPQSAQRPARRSTEVPQEVKERIMKALEGAPGEEMPADVDPAALMEAGVEEAVAPEAEEAAGEIVESAPMKHLQQSTSEKAAEVSGEAGQEGSVLVPTIITTQQQTQQTTTDQDTGSEAPPETAQQEETEPAQEEKPAPRCPDPSIVAAARAEAAALVQRITAGETVNNQEAQLILDRAAAYKGCP